MIRVQWTGSGGAALAGSQVLYLWPADGWLQGRVRRVCKRPGFSHVVSYPASSRLGAAEVDTLLDEASHGSTGRWHFLVPAGQRRTSSAGSGWGLTSASLRVLCGCLAGTHWYLS